MLPLTKMPPDTVNKAHNSKINGMYSAMMACATVCTASPAPYTMVKGIKNNSVHAAVILPKLWCHILGANKGNRAIDNKMQANGSPQSKLMSAGSKPVA